MPWMVKRTAVIEDREILRSAAGMNDVTDGVIDSTTVVEYPTEGSGRWILPAGTVLVKIAESSKVAPVGGAGVTGTGGDGAFVSDDIVGILAAKIEFWLGPGVTAGDATDEPCAIFNHTQHFNVSKLSGYTGNETAVKEALPTCKFD